MTIEPVQMEDAKALVRLAEQWGQRTFMWSPGAAGVVARDTDGSVQGFALITPRPYGLVADELWCAKTVRGRRATAKMLHWFEHAGKGHVGGIAREGTPLYAMLVRRGYTVAAHVLTKQVM
jgi:hypothetical protein